MTAAIKCKNIKTEQRYSHHPSIRFPAHYEAKWLRLVFSGIECILGISWALRNTSWELNLISLR